MSVEALKVAVILELQNLVSAGLKTVIKDIMGVDAAALKANKSISAMLGAGEIAMAAGTGTLWAIGKTIEAAGKLEDKINAVRSQYAEMTDDEEKGLRKWALAPSRFAGTPEQQVDVVRDNLAIFGNFEEAKEFAPEVLKLISATMTNQHVDFEQAEKRVNLLLRTAEDHGDFIDRKTGKITVAAGTEAMEKMVKLMNALGSKVSAEDIFRAQAMGSILTNLMPTEQLAKFEAQLLSVFKGNAGNMMQAFGKQFVGGTMTEKEGKVMESLGWLKKGMWKVSGGTITVDAGGWTSDKMDNGDAMGFIQDNLKKIHEKYLEYMAAHKNSKMSEDVYTSQQIGRLIAAAPDKRLWLDFYYNMPAILKEGGNYDRAQTADQALKTAEDKSLSYNVGLLSNALSRLWTTLGDALVPDAIKWIQKLTDAVNYITTTIQAMPDGQLHAIMSFFAELAGLLAVGGLAASCYALIQLFAAVRALAAAGGLAAGAGAGAAAGATGAGGVAGAAASASKLGFLRFLGTGFVYWEAFRNLLSHGQQGAEMWDKIYKENHLKDPDKPTIPSMTVKPDKPDQHSSTINLTVDGKKLASLVLDHMGRLIGGENVSETGYNYRGGYTPASNPIG